MNNIVKGVSRLLAVALATGGVVYANEKDSKVAETKSQVTENKVEEKEDQAVSESKKCRMEVTKTTINANGEQKTTKVEINDPEECDKVMKEMNLDECFGAFRNFSNFGSSAYYDFLDNFVSNDLILGGLGDYIWYNAWLNSFLNNNRKKQNDVDSKDKAGKSVEGEEGKSSDEEKTENDKGDSTAKPLDVSKDNEKK